MKKFNKWLAIKITGLVGTMYCAYVFMFIAMPALPNAFKSGPQGIVNWLSSNFIQLVLLPIIMVGQQLQAEQASDHHEEIKDLHKKHFNLLKRMDEK